MTKHTASGAFSSQFARRKRWKLDRQLADAVFPEIVSPFVDVGAGYGAYVNYWVSLGASGYGLDGIEGVDALTYGSVRCVDLSKPLYESKICAEKTAISIEVGEHIPPSCADVFLDNLCGLASERLVISWAVPGQRGTGHVNCQPPNWVRYQVCSRGFVVSRRTTELRAAAGRGWRKKLWLFERS